jgi:Fe-S oxidoreductase
LIKSSEFINSKSECEGEAFVNIPKKAEINFGVLGNEQSCCGGGDGRVWEETKKGERFSDIRLEQALDTEAEILAIACPYCMTMLQDSVSTSGKEDAIQIRDIAELVFEAM